MSDNRRQNLYHPAVSRANPLRVFVPGDERAENMSDEVGDVIRPGSPVDTLVESSRASNTSAAASNTSAAPTTTPQTPSSDIFGRDFGDGYLHMSRAQPGSGVTALHELQCSIENTSAELEKELKKTRFLGVQIGSDEKAAKLIKKIQESVSWMLTRIASEDTLYQEISNGAICAAYRPITLAFINMAIVLRDAGQQLEGYAKYNKKDRTTMEDAIHTLRRSVVGLVNCLLREPLRTKRLSDKARGESLYQSGQHTVTMLKRAEEAWAQEV